eukprot:m.493585 g.493585  ORF g.493585 m.493585 type:complete len:521 (-) comp37519_c0_seq1:72-1634(-)
MAASADTRRMLGVFGLVAVGFFWVSGGVYGNEAIVGAAPVPYVMAFLLGAPLIYALPSAIVCAELATAMPEDGGTVLWVTEAFGYRVGMHNGFWMLVVWLLDSSVYPVFAAEYVFYCDETEEDLDNDIPDFNHQDECKVVQRGGMAMGIVALVTLIKLSGMTWLTRASAILAIGTLLPPAILVFAGLPKLESRIWTETTGATDWVLVVSWVGWLNSGFLGLGALAGQVDRPRTYVISAVVLLIVATVVNVLPVVVSASLEADRAYFEPGFFGDLAADLVANWMLEAFQAGAVISMTGLYNAVSIQTEVSMIYLFSRLFPASYERMVVSQSWFFRIRDGTSPLFILINAALVCLAVWLPYAMLIEGGMLVYSFSAILTYAAFVYLRHKSPDMHRPFQVPGQGVGWALAWVLPPILFSVASIVIALIPEKDDPDAMNGLAIRTGILGGVIVVGVVGHFSMLHHQPCLDGAKGLGTWSHGGSNEAIALLADNGNGSATVLTQPALTHEADHGVAKPAAESSFA